MAPFFALGSALGLPVVARPAAVARRGARARRVGRGAAARRARRRRRGAASCTPRRARSTSLNPYVVVFADRTSITLLAYAALPWLLLCVHRGLRDAARVVVAGGVRARADAHRRRRERRGRPPGCCSARCCSSSTSAAGAAWRPARCGRGCCGSAAVQRGRPAVVGDPPCSCRRKRRAELPALHRAAGDDLVDDVAVGVAAADGLLDELPRRRLRRRPAAVLGHGDVLLFLAPVVLAGCSSRRSRWRRSAGRGARATRRSSSLLTLVGLLVMAAGLPGGDAAAARRDVHLQPRRGDPVPAHDLQGGAAGRRSGSRASAAPGSRRCGRGRRRRPRSPGRVARGGGRRRRGPRGARGVAARHAAAPWSASCVRRCPPCWRAVARDLDRRGDDTRALVVPGQLFAYYGWGGTIDPILPALTTHPVATRCIVPFADLRAADLQWTIDDLVGQQRAAARPARAAARPDGRRRPSSSPPTTTARAAGEAPAGDVAARARRARPRPGRRYGPAVRAAPDAGTLAPAPRVPGGARWIPVRTGGARARCCRARRDGRRRRRGRARRARGLRRAATRTAPIAYARRPRPGRRAARRGAGRGERS